jgi:uncharacterized membrane protein YeaQ/YmgE (transglycosylase-associated protein family)
MYLPLQALSVILLVGLVALWIVAKVVTKHGMGIAGDALVGVIGAFIGPWLLRRLGVHLGTGYVFAILSAAVGAVVGTDEYAKPRAAKFSAEVRVARPATNVVDAIVVEPVGQVA